MAFGDVEGGEIVPVVLDLGAGGDCKAKVGEDFGEFVHHLADRVDAALRARGDGKGDVDLLGRQPCFQRGKLQRVLAVGKGVDRQSVVWGKSVSVRVDPVGRRSIQKKTKKTN